MPFRAQQRAFGSRGPISPKRLQISYFNVPVNSGGLGVLQRWLNDGYVVGDVAVRRNDVQKAIEVIVHEKTAKGERLGRHLADAGSQRLVGEQTGTIVLVERHTLVRKISDQQARKARAVEVGRVCAHAGPHSARVAEGDSDVHANVGEGAVVIVVVELVGLGVIRNEEVHPTVVVIVEQ